MFSIVRRLKALLIQPSSPPSSCQSQNSSEENNEFQPEEFNEHGQNHFRPKKTRANYALDQTPSNRSWGRSSDMISCRSSLSRRLNDKLAPSQADMASVELEGEDSRERVLRLFRFHILHLACNMEPSSESDLDRTDPRFQPSPDYETVRACRLVCRDWNEEITELFLSEDKPVLYINPLQFLQKRKRSVDPAALLEVMSMSLARPVDFDETNSELHFPPFKLYLPSSFFYKEIESAFINRWEQFEQFLYELHLEFPADSTMSFFWPPLHMENLRKIKFRCNHDMQRLAGMTIMQPTKQGNHIYFIQAVLNGAPNADHFTLQCHAPHLTPDLSRMLLPKHLTFLDMPFVKMEPEELMNRLHDPYKSTCKNIKHLIVRAPLRAYKNDNGVTGCFASYLAKLHSDSLEELELNISGQELDHIVWTMRRDYVFEPLKTEFEDPLKKLRSLIIHAGNWEIMDVPDVRFMNRFQVKLPVLKNLKLTMISRESQIRALYQSRFDTVEQLSLSFINEMPYEVIRGFADNFPFLRELDIVVKESDVGVRLCFQGFLKLRRLLVCYAGCNDDNGREQLNSMVTGIPVEEFRTLASDEFVMMKTFKQFEHYSSLRDLHDLEEFKLIVKSHSKTDVSVMLLSTFLKMPKLRQLTFSERTLTIKEDLKDFIRKQNHNGASFTWI